MSRRQVWLALVRHFFSRFFEKEALSPDTDPQSNLVQTLALLAAPGGILCILMSVFNRGGWMLEAGRYFFISYSMIVMGLVVLLQWDKLFPDRQDYLILRPLPIRMIDVFTAKLAAMTVFVGLFLVDMNFFALFLWPALDDKKDLVRIFAVHILAIVSAGVFMALAAAALQGLLIAVLSPKWFRRISTLFQTVLTGALVTAFFLFPVVITTLPFTFRRETWAIYWFPCYWFLGLYEWLRPATNSAVLAGLGPWALKMLAYTAVVFLVTYSVGYQRHVRRMLESAPVQPGAPAVVGGWVSRLIDRTILTHPVQRAAFHFISATMARSTRHRLFLAGYGGFGAALVALNYGDGRGGLIVLPLMLSFVLVSGLRAAFNFPAELKANLAFQMAEGESRFEHLTATRKWVVVCGILPLFTVLAPFEFVLFPWAQAAFHTLYGIAVSVLVMEALFAGFRKVPFTCSYLPGKVNLVGLGAMYILGYTVYTNLVVSLELWLQQNPLAAAAFLVAVAVGWLELFRWNRRRLNQTPALDYLDAPDPAVRTLDLAGPGLWFR